jgi:hypothetical protein
VVLTVMSVVRQALTPGVLEDTMKDLPGEYHPLFSGEEEESFSS